MGLISCGLCPSCGYDRAGGVLGDPCPECGSTLEPTQGERDPALWAPERQRKVREGCTLLFWGGLLASSPVYLLILGMLGDWLIPNNPLMVFEPLFFMYMPAGFIGGSVLLAVGGVLLTTKGPGFALPASAHWVRWTPLFTLAGFGLSSMSVIWPALGVAVLLSLFG